MNLQRLDKIVSSGKNISRADARKLIRQGKITVGGEVIRDISLRLDAQILSSCFEHLTADLCRV